MTIEANSTTELEAVPRYSAVLTGANYYKVGPHSFRNGCPKIISIEVRDYLERTAPGLFTFAPVGANE